MDTKSYIKQNVDLYEYYARYVKPLRQEFSNGVYEKGSLVLCWFKDHDDVNPSMGSIRDKHIKGCMLYHCFGCGRTGDVIRLHQNIQMEYNNRSLTEQEACKELAGLFGLEIQDDIADDDYEAKYLQKSRQVDMLQRRYTEKDFSDKVLEIRKQGLDLSRLNSEVVKMTATVKQLYD